MRILVIDGQGGKIGKQLVSGIKEASMRAEVVAVGTNAMATAAMLKAGADVGATGENALIVNCRTADIIVGPLGIVIADSLLGEITPAMAAAVGQSPAKKLLIPFSRCDSLVVGTQGLSATALIKLALDALRELLAEERLL
ncbi:MAG: DUF3842 family protein [Christensenellaceae bacterium]|jgi:hypothetical protein|nr:DUF3842 family protein [Christensenellaceae bacterium]